jgi:TM2 domain-containing membrane protein YozV
MSKGSSGKSKQTFPALAGFLAWLIPGAGHLYIGRPVRAAVLFVSIHLLYWSGVLTGGVLTVDQRTQQWWALAQLGAGASGIVSWQRQSAVYADIGREVARRAAPTQQRRNRPAAPDAIAVEQVKAERNLAPTNDLAYVMVGVAGLLNVMCVFDAAMLSAMGVYGETSAPRRKEPS